MAILYTQCDECENPQYRQQLIEEYQEKAFLNYTLTFTLSRRLVFAVLSTERQLMDKYAKCANPQIKNGRVV